MAKPNRLSTSNFLLPTTPTLKSHLELPTIPLIFTLSKCFFCNYRTSFLQSSFPLNLFVTTSIPSTSQPQPTYHLKILLLNSPFTITLLLFVTDPQCYQSTNLVTCFWIRNKSPKQGKNLLSAYFLVTTHCHLFLHLKNTRGPSVREKKELKNCQGISFSFLQLINLFYLDL